MNSADSNLKAVQAVLKKERPMLTQNLFLTMSDNATIHKRGLYLFPHHYFECEMTMTELCGQSALQLDIHIS